MVQRATQHKFEVLITTNEGRSKSFVLLIFETKFTIFLK